MVFLQNEALTVLPIIGSNLVLLGIILFLINVFRHVKAENLRSHASSDKDVSL